MGTLRGGAAAHESKDRKYEGRPEMEKRTDCLHSSSQTCFLRQSQSIPSFRLRPVLLPVTRRPLQKQNQSLFLPISTSRSSHLTLVLSLVTELSQIPSISITPQPPSLPFSAHSLTLDRHTTHPLLKPSSACRVNVCPAGVNTHTDPPHHKRTHMGSFSQTFWSTALCLLLGVSSPPC